MDIRERTLAAFRVEYAEHVLFLRRALSDLEKGSGRVEEKQLFEMYRRAHSLKGAARAAGFGNVEALAHEIENLFSLVKGGDLTLDGELVPILLKVVDAIEDSAEGSDGADGEADISVQLEPVRTFLKEREVAWTDKPVVDETRQPDPASAAEDPRSDRVVDRALPTRTPYHNGARADGGVRPERSPSMEVADIRIAAGKLDELLGIAGQLVALGIGRSMHTGRITTLEEKLRSLERDLRGASGDGARSSGGLGLKQDEFEAIDRKVVEALVELNDLRRAFDGQSWQLQEHAKALQRAVARARMVSLERTFGVLPKMVRDLAREEGKEVEVRIEGLELEADRAVVQLLRDPAVHLLRNAVFHAIEMPDVRQEKGKKRAGRIDIVFAVDGNRLTLTISDDGVGVNFEDVRAHLRKIGAVPEGNERELSEDDVLRLLFRPGISTTESVTKVAGRGLGLSIVSETVTKLGGTVSTESEPGKGSRFTLEVPLTIATTHLLIVRHQERLFAIPAGYVEGVFRVHPSAVSNVGGESKVRLDGRHIRFSTLSALLRLDDGEIVLESEHLCVVLLHDQTEYYAVAVDGLLSIEEHTVLDLGVPFEMSGQMSGGIVTDDGSIVCVVNVGALTRALHFAKYDFTLSTKAPTVSERQPCLLVVDDSFTTRTLEKGVLEANGYAVHLAVDGLDALRLLREEVIDLIVTDIEMPRLDGWGLLKQVKADRSFSNLPVIIVTSKENAVDKQKGMSLGASAYIVKRQFDQQELLETIDQLL